MWSGALHAFGRGGGNALPDRPAGQPRALRRPGTAASNHRPVSCADHTAGGCGPGQGMGCRRWPPGAPRAVYLEESWGDLGGCRHLAIVIAGPIPSPLPSPSPLPPPRNIRGVATRTNATRALAATCLWVPAAGIVGNCGGGPRITSDTHKSRCPPRPPFSPQPPLAHTKQPPTLAGSAARPSRIPRRSAAATALQTLTDMG